MNISYNKVKKTVVTERKETVEETTANILSVFWSVNEITIKICDNTENEQRDIELIISGEDLKRFKEIVNQAYHGKDK